MKKKLVLTAYFIILLSLIILYRFQTIKNHEDLKEIQALLFSAISNNNKAETYYADHPVLYINNGRTSYIHKISDINQKISYLHKYGSIYYTHIDYQLYRIKENSFVANMKHEDFYSFSIKYRIINNERIISEIIEKQNLEGLKKCAGENDRKF